MDTITVNGTKLINCTPHTIRLQCDGDIIVLDPSGMTLRATPVEATAEKEIFGLELVSTYFEPSSDGEFELEDIESAGMVPIGSIISAQAWPGRVVSLVPVPGYERVPPAEKLYHAGKFNIF